MIPRSQLQSSTGLQPAIKSVIGGLKNERKNKLRQSNSESIIIERKYRDQKKPLDPRIYPAWWGEPNDESFQKYGNQPNMEEYESSEVYK